MAPRRRLISGGRVFQNLDSNRRGAAPGSSAPWSSVLALVGFVGLCLLLGAANGAVTATSVRTWYLSLTPPPGTPPNWVFPVVWNILYVLIGSAAWLVWRRPGYRRPLRLWGWQLLVSAAWTPVFFALHSTGAALLVLLFLLVLIAWTIRSFAAVDRIAAVLLVPYLLWSTYATYLNAGFWWLNAA